MPTSIKMTSCHKCGGQKFRAAEKVLTRTVDERKFTAKVAGKQCLRCGSIFFSATDADYFQLAVAARLADLGALSGEAFAFMRKALGFDAADVADLYGVEPEAVIRWESGDRILDRAVFISLAAVVQDKLLGRSTVLDWFRALDRPAPRRRAPIQVEVFTPPPRPRRG